MSSRRVVITGIALLTFGMVYFQEKVEPEVLINLIQPVLLQLLQP